MPMLLVTPCVGVWIETFRVPEVVHLMLSHPAWVCGLKLTTNYFPEWVTKSHPAWVCGLKQN